MDGLSLTQSQKKIFVKEEEQETLPKNIWRRKTQISILLCFEWIFLSHEAAWKIFLSIPYIREIYRHFETEQDFLQVSVKWIIFSVHPLLESSMDIFVDDFSSILFFEFKIDLLFEYKPDSLPA